METDEMMGGFSDEARPEKVAAAAIAAGLVAIGSENHANRAEMPRGSAPIVGGLVIPQGATELMYDPLSTNPTMTKAYPIGWGHA